jgi:DNA-binding Lrp family transcriptional regulator
MPIAFILINTTAGAEEKVVEKLRNMEGVDEVHTVYGTYDIVAKIRIKSAADKLKEDVTWHIRRMNEVQSTTTLVVAN